MSDPTDTHDEAGATLAQLRHALEFLPDAIALFDDSDRLVLWNSCYQDSYLGGLDLRVGDTFEDVLAASMGRGNVPLTGAERDRWMAERLSQHRLPASDFEHQLADGRWVSVRERRTAQGWTIGIRRDITESKQREASFRLLFEANPTPMYVVDRRTLRFIDVNDAALRLYGYSRERFLSMTMLDTRPARDHASFLRVVADGSVFDYPGLRAWSHLRADGDEIRIVPYTRSMMFEGRPACVVSIVDLTRQEDAERELRRAKAFLDSVVAAIPLGIFVKDMRDDGRYVVYNQACGEIVGRDRTTVVGRCDVDVFGAEEGSRFIEQDLRAMAAGELLELPCEAVTRASGEVRLISTKKIPIPDGEDGQPRYLAGIAEDVTERERLAARLDHMAHHDALTGLPNRVVLDRRLEAFCADRDPHGSAAVLYIDLDRFKAVNDSLGHRVGDLLLKAATKRMRSLAPAQDVTCRIGGDEFVVFVSPATCIEDLQGFAEALIAALSAPYRIDGRTVSIGASVGIAVVPPGRVEPGTLLRDADVALYASKTAGGGIATLFVPEMEVRARSKREIDAELRGALGRGELDLFYQPVVHARRGHVVGYEALMRWHHPERGLVPPGDFIPLAEASGSIVPMGMWALGRACRDAASRSDALWVAVNLSAVQFRDDQLVATVAAALAGSGLAPHRLELEVTESVLLGASDRNLETLQALRGLGVRIALDDFGTGYSSLSYLQRFPFDKVKVDRSFVRGLPEDARSLAILRAVMALATSLGIETTAEGVETAEQLACLNREACRLAQGYLFGPPKPGFGWLGAARPSRARPKAA